MRYKQVMNIKQYLSQIGKKGGKAVSALKRDAVRANAIKAREALALKRQADKDAQAALPPVSDI